MRILFIHFFIITFTLFATAQEWIDMGTFTEDGDKILWSSSEIIISNNRATFAASYQMGTSVGWGDITGKATSLYGCGGNTPPINIAGNPKYDIVTAFLGDGYRLPTFYDYKELLENAKADIEKVKRNYSVYGMPEWVQGQWLWNDASLIGGKAVNYSISLKIDGALASVSTNNGRTWDSWEGAYSYSNGYIRVRDLNLRIDYSRKCLIDGNHYFKKVSDNAESGVSYNLSVRSRLNGNSITIPMPESMSQIANSRTVMSWRNEIKHYFWLGDRDEDDNEYARSVCFDIDNASCYAISIKRNTKIHIRPVKIIKAAKSSQNTSIINAIKKRANEIVAISQELAKKYKNNYVEDIPYARRFLENISNYYKCNLQELKSIQSMINEEYDKLIDTQIEYKTGEYKKKKQ